MSSGPEGEALPDRTTNGEPLRVLRIITRLNIGGPALQIAVHAHHLPGADLEQLIVFGSPDPSEGDLSDRVIDGPSRTLHLAELSRPIRPFRDLRAFRRLVSLIRSERPHVVHTHLFKAGLLGRVAAWWCGVPVRVHTYHGTVFEGHFGPFASWMSRTIERWLGRITHRVVALGPSQHRDLVGRHGVVPGSRVVEIEPGCDFRRFDDSYGHREGMRAELATPLQAPVILVLGRLAPVKNVELALRITARVVAALPDVRLWIAGDGPDRKALEAACARLGLVDRTRFLGFRDDPERLLGGADLLLLTSKSEGLPVAVIEAMAARCPVVATDVGGLRDLIEPGVNGLLHPLEDEEGLAASVQLLLEDVERADQIAKKALVTIERFSVDRYVARHRELYGELTAHPPGKP